MEDLENETVICVNVSQELENKVLNFLLSLRNIIERGFFNEYYNKTDFREDLANINMPVDVLMKKFSFISISARDEKAISKDDVYTLLKSPNVRATVEVCVKACLVYCRHTTEIYEVNTKAAYDGFALLNVVDKLATCAATFQSTPVIKMDVINDLLAGFVVYVLKKIAALDENGFEKKGGIYYGLLSHLLINLINLEAMQIAMLNTIAELFSRIINYMMDKKVTKMEPFHNEAYGILLNIVIEIVKLPLTKTANDYDAKNEARQALTGVLIDIRKFLPDSIDYFTEWVIDTISCHMTEI